MNDEEKRSEKLREEHFQEWKRKQERPLWQDPTFWQLIFALLFGAFLVTTCGFVRT